MKGLKRILALSFAAVAVAALAMCGLGCSGGQGGSGGQSSTKAQFEGFDARSIDDLANLAEKAMEEAKELDDKSPDSEQKSKAASLFAEGNTKYRAMSYAEATQKYQEALEYNPVHHGSNVNLTLSLLQEGRDEEALSQALKCVALFPEEAGCLLNAQVAGTACKFSADDLDIWLGLIVNDRANTSVSAVLMPSSKANGSANDMVWDEAYNYNSIWSRIETELYQGKKTSENAVEIAPIDAYLSLKEALSWFDSDDVDAAALQAYLEAVAQQLGLSEEG